LSKSSPAEWPAKRALATFARAIESRRREVYIGKKEVLGAYLSRLVPNLFHRIIRNTKLK
jgi:hypothetical protein